MDIQLKAEISIGFSIFLALVILGCSKMAPMPVVQKVDLDKFMGKWYVVASIPTFFERKAFDATEYYERGDNNKILTTFSFRSGSHQGELKTYHPTGFVTDHPSNAIWGMQFLWPIKADYRIIRLNHDYSQTVIGRENRDYLWIMARTAEISVADLEEHIHFLKQLGYDTSQIKEVPHSGTRTMTRPKQTDLN